MKKTILLLSLFFLAKILLQYVLINPIYELHRDEFLYLDQANHLAWGYRSVPPFTSWISLLIQNLGNTVFWVRFFPALFGALTILVVWKTIETLKGNLYACILAATALLCSTTFLRLNMLFHANSVDIFCWTFSFYILIRYIQTEQSKWIYLMAIAFAIGFLNKYNIIFLVIGLFPALLLSQQRKLFLKKDFYIAMLLGLAIISPNLIWQFQNGLPVFSHLKELNETQLIYISRFDFLEEQIYFFLGSVFILIAGFISLFNYKSFKPYRLLFWSYLVTILVFIYLKAKAYYAFGLYPVFLAFGSIYLSELLQKGRLLHIRYVAIGIILLMSWLLIPISMPIYTPQEYIEAGKTNKPFSKHTWEDGKTHFISQDFADMLGWKELAHKVDSIYENIEDKKHTLIFCDNYGQTGAINYYSKKDVRANSFNADYVDWTDFKEEIRTIIRIKEAKHQDLSIEKKLFGDITPVAKIEDHFAREKGTWIIILTNPKADIKEALKYEVKKIKERFPD